MKMPYGSMFQFYDMDGNRVLLRGSQRYIKLPRTVPGLLKTGCRSRAMKVFDCRMDSWRIHTCICKTGLKYVRRINRIRAHSNNRERMSLGKLQKANKGRTVNLKNKLLAEQVQEQIYQYILETPIAVGANSNNEFEDWGRGLVWEGVPSGKR